MDAYPRFLPVGDAALTVEFGNVIHPSINAAAIALDMKLAASEIPGITETVPSYRALLVRYDPTVVRFEEIVAALQTLIQRGAQASARTGKHWIVPVVYDARFATDLIEVAERLGMSPGRVITAHAELEYKVYTIGFLPGMPLMGSLPERLHISRRQSPRPGVPAGAVIIGGMQTSIVPMSTLSGWYILGRTPVRPFDKRRTNPFLFSVGDTVRFQPIGSDDYRRIEMLSREDLLSMIGGSF